MAPISLNMLDITLLVAMFLGNAVLISFGNMFISKFGEEQVASIRTKLIAHIYQLRIPFFHYQKSGELASQIINDTVLIRDFIIGVIPNLLAGLVTLLGALVVLVLLDWKLTAVMCIGLPLMVLFVLPISKISEKSTKQMQGHISTLIGDLTEGLQEIEMIKLMTSEDHMVQKHSKEVKHIEKLSLKNDFLLAFEQPLGLLFFFGLMGVIFLYGGRRVVDGSLTVGTLITFMIYLLQLLNPVGALSSARVAFAKQKGAMTSLETILQEPVEEILGEQPITSGDLVFHDISFSYQKNAPIIDHVTLTLKQGEKTALVGPSGSGK